MSDDFDDLPVSLTHETATAAGAAIAFDGVGYTLPDGRALFSGIDLLVHPGTVVAVTTPLGGGKSTLLRLAVGLASPTSGSVRVLGRDPAAPDRDGSLRRRIGYVPHDGALLSNLFLYDNLVLPLRWHTDLKPIAISEKARAALDVFGVGDLPRIQPPTAGTALRRQVALARSIILDPDVLVLDEPGADLDEGTARDVWHHLTEIAAAHRVAVLATAPADPRVSGVHHVQLVSHTAATRAWLQPRSNARLSALRPIIPPAATP